MVKIKRRIEKATVYIAAVDFNSLSGKWEVSDNGKISYFTFFRNAILFFNQIVRKAESSKAQGGVLKNEKRRI